MSKERIPVGRFGEINELANLAMYLVSDYANWVTGEVLWYSMEQFYFILFVYQWYIS